MYSYQKTQHEPLQNELIVIQYPGIIKNVDRALETLGGLPKISQRLSFVLLLSIAFVVRHLPTLQNHFCGHALELRHTPENPYTSASVSEKKVDAVVTSGTLRVIMQIRRKKKKPSVIETKFLGLVNYVYTFDTMCDFQYLPLKKRQDKDEFDDLIPRLIPQDLPGAWDRPDAHPGYTPLYLPPYQFSRYNTPSNKLLCRDTDFALEKSRRKTGHGQNLRLHRKALSVTVQANDIFPDAPTPEAVADADFRCKNEEPHKMIAALYRERPMWTRVAIAYKTGLEYTLLKTLLQKYAFYIQSGPWGRLWCKFGYDPRKDPEAKNYQTLMVSFRQHTRIPERQRLKVSSDRGYQSDASAIVHYTYQQGAYYAQINALLSATYLASTSCSLPHYFAN
ncbi:unnamed protein product [Cylicostephanus goldi]|uniref:Transcription factor IIIC subunit 5 HTH domain-containing protein n=1 Tax=Cylicostephanus goldi TaxID=71465 RepID=A0A3P6S176_CYLGO|nr:unnamed protein product [Cylicostephanus goldi]